MEVFNSGCRLQSINRSMIPTSKLGQMAWRRRTLGAKIVLQYSLRTHGQIQRNRWLFFFYGARCCAAVQGITSSRADSAATGPLKARTSQRSQNKRSHDDPSHGYAICKKVDRECRARSNKNKWEFASSSNSIERQTDHLRRAQSRRASPAGTEVVEQTLKPNALSAGGHLPPVVVVIVAGVRPIPVAGIPVRVASVSVGRAVNVWTIVIVEIGPILHLGRRGRFGRDRARRHRRS